jgi:hypothetical protein
MCDLLPWIKWYEHLRRFQDVKDTNAPQCFVERAFRLLLSFGYYRGVHCDIHNESNHIMGENSYLF